MNSIRIGRLEITWLPKSESKSHYPFGWRRNVKKIIAKHKRPISKDDPFHTSNWKIPAIKECRALYGWGLKESKENVEEIELTMRDPLDEFEKDLLKIQPGGISDGSQDQ